MHKEILDEKRLRVMDILGKNSPGFVLGGGTAIALQIGHRKSYDFDFFSKEPISKRLLNKCNEVFHNFEVRPVVDNSDELSFVIDGEIKISFIYFPFIALHSSISEDGINFFDLRDLASSKAYAIGRRGVWRDYADMFFLLKRGIELSEIIKETKQRFKGGFDGKLFLEQLVYFQDLGDFEIEFLAEKYSQDEIETYLLEEVKKVF